ncbi:MAG: hypothetical protein ACJ785_04785 [Gemmatimonadaceae bacterium]
MRALQRKLRGASTRGGVFIVLALLLAAPLGAQKTAFALSGGTIVFPAPTAVDYIAGWINSSNGVTFTVNAQTGASRTTTVSIRAISATLGSGKVIGDLQWRRSDLATWNSISLADTQVEQRIVIRNGLNDPWSNTIFFRMVLNWTADGPATYSADYQITVAQTVP